MNALDELVVAAGKMLGGLKTPTNKQGRGCAQSAVCFRILLIH